MIKGTSSQNLSADEMISVNLPHRKNMGKKQSKKNITASSKKRHDMIRFLIFNPMVGAFVVRLSTTRSLTCKLNRFDKNYPKLTGIAPANSHSKRKFMFQPPIFRGELAVSFKAGNLSTAVFFGGG